MIHVHDVGNVLHHWFNGNHFFFGTKHFSFFLWDAPKKIFDSPAEPCQRACFTSTAPHFDMIAIAHCLPSSRSPSLSVGLNAPLNPLANLLANLLAKWIANSNKPLLNSYIIALIMLTC